MRSVITVVRTLFQRLHATSRWGGRFLADPRGILEEFRIRRRRHKLVMVYAKEARVRHGLGPGVSPILYAYDRLYREGLTTPTEDGLEWHWPETTTAGERHDE
ncbi:hypothetical protein [Haloferax sp. ATB1]|uniref:hypothetical protein n=1 Tax=Haloferax sp. ATB1 TaxID=1508454 RepID=UPI0005B1F1F6|nr:hypothetical protein [Haloferax sp. ATB1]